MSDSKVTKEIVYRGKIFEIEQATQLDGRVFERAVRAPGVRLIIPDRENKRLLLTKEFRTEIQDWDIRLPGGKVFDTLAEYEEFRSSNSDILVPAEQKAKGEGAEEAGIDVNSVALYKTSKLGATVEWDLLVFEVTDWAEHPDGQQLEEGEQIEKPQLYSYDEVRKMILGGHMQEERVALVLLQWLSEQK